MRSCEVALGVVQGEDYAVLAIRAATSAELPAGELPTALRRQLEELLESADSRELYGSLEINVGPASRYQGTDCRQPVRTLLENNGFEVITRNLVSLEDEEPVFKHVDAYSREQAAS